MINKKELYKHLKINLMTNSQKKAVLSTETPILLSASAGSGKTFVLSARVVYKLLNMNNFIEPKDLLVVTFAKTAAKEMFERISSQMKNLVIKYPENKDLRKQYSSLSAANITTIDSFCSNLLRENFELINLSPDFKIAEESEIFNLKSEILDEIFEDKYCTSAENFQALCDYFSLNKNLGLKKALLEIYDKSRTYPFPKIYLSSILYKYENPQPLDENEWAQEVKEGIFDEIKKAEFLISDSLNYMDDPILRESFSPIVKEMIQQLENISKKIKKSKYSQILDIIQEINFKNFPRYNKKTNPFDKELANEIKAKYINPAKKIIQSLSNYLVTKEQYFEDLKQQSPILKQLINLSLEFSQKMHIKKQELNLLEFSDLLLKTLELLAIPTNNGFVLTKLGKKMSSRFKEVLVDEFQDVNKAQDMLFQILSDNGQNLFMVGDVKQSIYRFRQADPKVFISHKQKYSLKNCIGNVITLNNNFRSRKEVTNSVNFLFGQIMSEEFGGSDYKNGEQLFSSSYFPYIENLSTEFHIIDNSCDDENNIECESKHIASRIKFMLVNKMKISDKNSSRICQPKDFAILFRSGKKIEKVLCKYLSEFDIPFTSSSESGYLDSYEVSLTISLLKSISNPLLDIPLCAVLLSPMFNFSISELAQIRLNNENKPVYIAIKESQNEKCKSFIEELSSLQKKSTTLSISQLIQEIYNHNLFYLFLSISESSEQKLFNLKLLIHNAKKYEEFNDCGLTGFLKNIDLCKKNETQSASSSSNMDKNAVKIMTIHKSKGLEFPVVFLSFCGKKFNMQDFNQPILFSSQFGMALKHSNPQTLSRYNTLAFNASVFSEKNAMKAEELRLLYVAMTRAKDKLILTAVDKDQKYKNSIPYSSALLPTSYCKNKNSFYEWILAGFLRHKDACFKNPKISFDSEEFDCRIKIINKFEKIQTEEKEKKTEKYDPKMVEKIKKQVEFKFSNQHLSSIPAKLSVSDITPQHKSRNLRTLSFSESPTPTEIGIATHEFLQYANLKNAKHDINNEIKRLVEKEYITKKQAKFLDKNQLQHFFKSKIYHLIQTADSVQREKSFACEIYAKEIYKIKDDSKIILHGIIDCLIEKDNKLIVVDYKTDQAFEPQLKQLYSKQLLYYKHALEKSTLKKVDGCYIYSFYLNKTIQCH